MESAAEVLERRRGGERGLPPASDLRLVELLLAEEEPAACAEGALRWIGSELGAGRAVSAVVDPLERRLVGLAGLGVDDDELAGFGVDLEDRRNPLVIALGGSEPVRFNVPSGRRPAPGTPLGAGPFWCVTLSPPEDGEGVGLGLLLVAEPRDGASRVRAALRWAADVLATRLASLRYEEVRREERRHRQERSWLLGIVEAVTDPILLTDADGRILIANRSAEKLFSSEDQMSEGRRRAVALNNMLFSASAVTDPEGDDGAPPEVLLVDPIDGHDLLFELLSTPMEIRSGENGRVSILRNVTDLKLAAEEIEENYRKLRAADAKTRAERDRLKLILSAVADPVLVTDHAGNIMMMNTPAERMFTVPSEGHDEVAERRVQANDAVFTSTVSNVYAGPSRSWRGELELIDPQTGRTVPVEAIAGKVLSEHGEDSALVTILHDLTEAKEKAQLYEQVKRHSEELQRKVREATAELAEQNELLRRQALDLEQASAMKSQFLANASHELRTPLNAMIGYTALLLEGVAGELTEAQREKLKRLESNAQHLLSIINDLLDITRIEAGKIATQLTTFDLRELVREVMAEVEPLIAASDVAVSHHVADAVSTVRSDRKKVKQILINLLSNALKFTSEGSTSILAEEDAERDRIAIAVSDTGIGISEEHQKTIFEAFGRSEPSFSHRQAGTGLGLSICRRLAQVLGGDIELESAVGEGSTFTLRLPRSPGEAR